MHRTVSILRLPIVLVVLLISFGISSELISAAGTVTNCTTFGTVGTSGDLADALKGGRTITFSCSGTIIVPEITISADTRISARGKNVTLSGNNSNRVFRVKKGVSLELDTLTISNGFSTESGGGIANFGTLKVINSVISGNRSDAYAGGILNSDGKLIVSNTTFSNNTAVNDGGGINSSGSLTVINSTFAGNAAYLGGGILVAEGTVTVTNTRFTSNTTSGLAGGAGMMVGGNGKTIGAVINSTFSGNTADGAGGALFVSRGGLLMVINSTFTNNAAFRGGGVLNAGTLTVINSTFSGNRSDTYAGGILNDGGQLIVSNTTFSNNTAVNDGGGINSSGSLTVINSAFSGNAAYLGGGILVAEGTVTVTNTTFSGNTTSGLAGGAGMMVGKSIGTVMNSTFANNTADGAGGALFVPMGSSLTVINSTFAGNTAFNGGGILNVGTLTVINSTFSGNKTTDGGSGGGIYNMNPGILTLYNTIIANSPSGGDCLNQATLNAHINLIEDGSCHATLSGDPVLDPAGLRNNGGPTQTIVLQSNSPAINAGINDDVPSGVRTDQRGLGFRRIIQGKVDLGAVETNLAKAGVQAAPTFQPPR
jgi:predicted outer membrane repeat protein